MPPSHPVGADLYGDLLDYEKPQPHRLSAYMPGLTVAGIAALAAAYLSEHYGAPLMLMGLLIGLSLNFVNAVPQLDTGLNFASRSLLRWGIVVLGSQITLSQIASLGLGGLATVATMIVLVTLTGLVVARVMRLSPWVGLLAGGAVAICGASAALAIAALLGEKRVNRAQLTLVLVCVAAASAFAMSSYPLLAHAIGLNDRQAGFLIGASIHDVAQALGAGYSVSPESGESATIVKLTRVALLAPTLAIISLFLPKDGEGQGGRITVPWFVLGFFALAAASSFVAPPPLATKIASHFASALLLIAVVATGIGSPMRMLLEQGWRASMPVAIATIVSFALALAATLIV